MFQSIWTIFKEPTLILAKVTLFQILPLKNAVLKDFQCRGSAIGRWLHFVNINQQKHTHLPVNNSITHPKPIHRFT
jgi:hypothetical protein